jgi:hypothetical protein
MQRTVKAGSIPKQKKPEKTWTKEEEKKWTPNTAPMRPGDAVGPRLTLEDLEAERDEKAVLVGMTFYSLYDVNPQAQCFSAELTVKLWWWESPEKNADVYDWKKEQDDTKKFPPEEFEKTFNVPKIFFSNGRELVDVDEIPPSCEVRKEWPVGAVGYERRVRGTFEELFELDFFPYDVQALTVQLRVNSKQDFSMNRYLALNMGKKAHAMIPQVKGEGRFSEWKRYKASALAGKHDIQKRPLLYEAHICLWRRHRCKLSRLNHQRSPALRHMCLAASFSLRLLARLLLLMRDCSVEIISSDLL